MEAEWATARITSSYDAYIDADACCVGTMASASLYQHHPLPERLVQRPPPTRSQLIARGLLGADGRVVPSLVYVFYAGDFDSAAWLYQELLPRWEDAGRGQVPIAWPVDPELALRFPPIFPLLYATASPSDVIVAGDSGAGYINPTQLYGPARAAAGGAGDGRARWLRWNEGWYRQMGLSVTGFIITGDAPQMNDTDLLTYFPFSPNGAVVQAFPGVREHLAGEMPVTGETDIPSDVAPAAALIASYLPGVKGKTRFWEFRSVLTSPSYLRDVEAAVSAQTNGTAVAVDALSFGYLMRAAYGGSNDDRVAYVQDSLPRSAASGASVSFNATVRNDGWNALAAVNHSLAVRVDDIHFLRTTTPRRTRAVDESSAWPASAAGRIGSALAHQHWPANPALAKQLMHRLALQEVESVGSRLREEREWRLPEDVAVGGEVEVRAKVRMPSQGELRRRCPDCFTESGLREEVAVLAVVQYEMAERLNGSWVGLREKGNLPWRTVVWLL